MNQQIAGPQRPITERAFTVRLSPTRRGARLARLLTVAHLGLCGLPSAAAAHIVAELAANAAAHGRVPGRDFQLAVTVSEGTTLRIELTDTKGDQLPVAASAPDEHSEGGRGLLIVEAMADRWGVALGPVPRKTVWAELDLVP